MAASTPDARVSVMRPGLDEKILSINPEACKYCWYEQEVAIAPRPEPAWVTDAINSTARWHVDAPNSHDEHKWATVNRPQMTEDIAGAADFLACMRDPTRTPRYPWAIKALRRWRPQP